MPSSFSRFLSDEELEKVRKLYLESLETDEELGDTPGEPATAPGAAHDG
jgi:hypothetical protein